MNKNTWETKIIFVTWWAISWLGKVITSSSIWKLMKSSGLSVWMVKLDPYLQVDAGTMSPYEHGEVFVTEDGAETDLDIGNYERFTSENFTKDSNVTTGKVYLNVITRERNGDFLWKTVQIIPHITNEIKENILLTAGRFDITIVEVWWTVWDIESQPFLESIRQLKNDLGNNNVMFIHVAPLLHLSYSGEVKTKLIQYSVIKLREVGILPDVIVCRSEQSLSEKVRSKISMSCGVPVSHVIEAVNAKTIYDVPEKFREQNLDTTIFEFFWYSENKSDLKHWNILASKIVNAQQEVTVWIIWKYVEFEDTYKSISEALIHAGVANDVRINIEWICSDALEKHMNTVTNIHDILEWLCEKNNIDGILIPGGFWERWVEGKIKAVEFARKKSIPFLWICLWMQVAVIEYARNICGLKDSNSAEFDMNAEHRIIDIMEDQKTIKKKWWTMRLWAYDAILQPKSIVADLYDSMTVSERHRHRYEVNIKYHDDLQKGDLVFSGLSPNKKLVEFIELKNHPFFVATQGHPEFKSRIDTPHPLFVGFVKACLSHKK